MKVFLAGLLTLLIFQAPQSLAGQRPTQRPTLCGDMMRIQKVLEDARVMAAELRGMASAQKDYITRRELMRKAKKLTDMVQTLRGELALPLEPEHAEPVPPEPVAPVMHPMTPADFHQLLSALEAEGFSKGKFRVLQSAIPHNNFTVEQVKKVMKKFSFSKGKTRAAAMMYPRILDKNNFYKVYEELPFDSDKEKLKQMISK